MCELQTIDQHACKISSFKLGNCTRIILNRLVQVFWKSNYSKHCYYFLLFFIRWPLVNVKDNYIYAQIKSKVFQVVCMDSIPNLLHHIRKTHSYSNSESTYQIYPSPVTEKHYTRLCDLPLVHPILSKILNNFYFL
jgi:hypothetical protein